MKEHSKNRFPVNVLIFVLIFVLLSAITVSATETDEKMCSRFIPEKGVMWTGTEWNGADRGEYPNRNCDIVSIGREPARTDSIPYADPEEAVLSARNYEKERSPYYLLLSQTDWKFYWLENPEEFRVSDVTEFYEPGFDDSDWDNILVPSVWQTQGYDHPIYTMTTQKFARNFGNDEIGYPRDLPKAPTYYNPVGLYRYEFEIPAEWEGRRVYIDLEGVDSAFYLWINGIQTGYAEDSFTSNEFDITDYVQFGEMNTLAAKVYRWCDGSWLEDQDFYDLSGIFRDVYVYATPQVRVRDFSIVTDFDETFTDAVLEADVYVHNYTDEPAQAELELKLLDADMEEIVLSEASGDSDEDGREAEAPGEVPADDNEDGQAAGEDEITKEETKNEDDDPAWGASKWNGTLEPGEERIVSFRIPVSSPRKWSAEDPYLYTLLIREESGTEAAVWESCQVGFRKITYKTTESGWYEGSPTDWDLVRINGEPIMFRGVDRHETHPELGYALTREVMEEDIRIMLENNINAVRTSHYPNSNYWYYLCDKYGIYVMDEANVECHSNMLNENERITEYLSRSVIDREYNMIRRDRNHASVVMWSLGNENKNPEILRTILIEPYEDPEGTERILHEYTKDRPWHYEQARDMVEIGIDVISGMYAEVDELTAHGVEDGPVPMIECEYEHAMGNSEGNFDEYWEAFDTYRNLQGGFIWDYIDQSIYAETEDGELYFGYGGDHGESIHDENFCANGLLLPDRTVQPEMAEVRYFYQQLRFVDAGVENGQIEIRNFHLFTDIPDKYEVRWELLENNTVIQEGTVEEEQLHIPCVDSVTAQPGSAVVQIPVSAAELSIRPGCEYFLNIEAVLKEDTGLLPAGYTVAYEQFELDTVISDTAGAGTKRADSAEIQDVQGSQNTWEIQDTQEIRESQDDQKAQDRQETISIETTAEEQKVVPSELKVVFEGTSFTVIGDNFQVTFDREQGRMVRYTAGGRDLIVNGEGPAGSFFRAGTDNDRGMGGSSIQVFTLPWKDPGQYIISSFQDEFAAPNSAAQTAASAEVEQETGKKGTPVTVSIMGTYPELNDLELDTVYQVWPDGSIDMEVTILPQYNETFVYIPVAGVQLTVPGNYEQITWFGRGPEENYQDRKQGTKVGVYETTVTDNFFPYVQSSETGNRTDVRWIALTDEEGYGLLACAQDTPIETSALHYTAEELDRAVHPYELNELEDTILRLNYVQLGVGGDNAWERIIPHEQYLPHDEVYHYAVTFVPLTPETDPMEAYVSRLER